MRITRVEFEVKRREYVLSRAPGGKWELFNDLERLQTFDEITEENRGRVAIRLFELTNNFIGTFGDLEPYLNLLKQIKE